MFGARPLGRVIQKEVRDPLTDEILFGALEHGGTVTIGVKDDHLTFDLRGAALRSRDGSTGSREIVRSRFELNAERIEHGRHHSISAGGHQDIHHLPGVEMGAEGVPGPVRHHIVAVDFIRCLKQRSFGRVPARRVGPLGESSVTETRARPVPPCSALPTSNRPIQPIRRIRNFPNPPRKLFFKTNFSGRPLSRFLGP